MNEMAASHQNIISQKDKQLAEFQKQVDALQKAESDLNKQIEEQKAKNNVSCTISLLFFIQNCPSRSHPIRLLRLAVSPADFEALKLWIWNFKPSESSEDSESLKLLSQREKPPTWEAFRIYFWFFWRFISSSFFSLSNTHTRTTQNDRRTGFANEKLEIGWGIANSANSDGQAD